MPFPRIRPIDGPGGRAVERNRAVQPYGMAPAVAPSSLVGHGDTYTDGAAREGPLAVDPAFLNEEPRIPSLSRILHRFCFHKAERVRRHLARVPASDALSGLMNRVSLVHKWFRYVRISDFPSIIKSGSKGLVEGLNVGERL